MICPICGNKPISFASFLVTLNPFRIRCVNCDAPLRAGPVAYMWAGLHVLLGIGLIFLHRRLMLSGVIASPAGVAMYLIGIFGLLFITAYVIPWVFLTNIYQAE